jgi:hypothetical protein
MRSGFVMLFREAMGCQQHIGGWRATCGGGLLDPGLRFQIDGHQRFILGWVARTAESQFEIRVGEFFRVFEMLGQLAVAPGTGESSMLHPHLEQFNLFVTAIAPTISSGRVRLFCRTGKAEVKDQA